MAIFAPFGFYQQKIIEAGSSFDPAAQAFFTATGITDATIQDAVNQLVLDLKSAGIWSEFDAIYPFVGATATTHKYNLKDTSTYEITFSGTWTHNSNGITGNGSNTYGNTGWNPTSVGRTTNGHMSIYSRTNYNSGGGVLMSDMGCGSSPAESLMALANSGTTFWIYNSAQLNNAYGNTQGHYITRRNASNTLGVKNGSTVKTGGTGTGYPNRDMYIGAQNTTGGAARWTNRNYAFASLGTDISDQSSFYTAVQDFQTALSRQV